MLPAGPLMKEHRLIEKMIAILKTGIDRIQETGTFNPSFIENAVDFFRTYADRTHHGKEEDILFKKLAEKKMKPEHQKIMDELIAEHKFARGKVKALHEAAHRSIQDKNALRDVTDSIQALASFYPAHIEKEDKRFFLPVMEYLSGEEQSQMLENFTAFDRSMIHEKYEKLIQTFPDATP